MKFAALFAASTLALCVFCASADAMSTIPDTRQNSDSKSGSGVNGLLRNPKSSDNVRNPYAYSPFGNGIYNEQPRNDAYGSDRNFLNVDPFDPNSSINSYDRSRYANPYPYDPIYNPYGQSSSPYAPMAPDVMPGHGIPYGR